ncbi:MAG: YbjQ family protein [Armatimonadetes bacterium]|nr:YbjQ family protein [Armatimonadota bacterium]
MSEIHQWITTSNGFDGYKVVRYLGVVRGITVRSRSLFGQIGAGFQSLAGGNISLYTELCEHARLEAYEIMIQHAAQVGANAVVAMRYDANEVGQGITEVIAYGTAVQIAPL